MVAYLLIIFFTVLFLTYITYKVSSFFSYHLPLKTLFLYAFFACILGLLVPRLIAMSNILMWLIVLMSLLVLSSYVLSRSTDILVEDTAKTNSMPSFQHEIPEDGNPVKADSFLIASSAVGGSGVSQNINAIPMSVVSTVNQEMDESEYVAVLEQTNDEAQVATEEINSVADEISPVGIEDLYQAGYGEADESHRDLVLEEIPPIIDEIVDMAEESLPEIVDINQAASPGESENDGLFPGAAGDADESNEKSIHKENLPVFDIEEETVPAIVEVSDITSCLDADELYAAEGANMENSINNDEVHDIAYYLDLGFAARESGNYRTAAIAFQKAIDIEPDNPSVLLIIIEICALLKLQGFYDDAIGQMQKGRHLAFTASDESMVGEFVDGIAYLRILKNILLTKGLQFTPYPALPEDIKLEIDEEFRQWKTQQIK